MTTTTASVLELPAHLERELNVLGVLRALPFPEQRKPDWSFKAPVFDLNGQPEF